MLDRAIDGAVRQMLDAEPRPGLRTRVVARIANAEPGVASGSSRKDPFGRWLWIGAPMAAAAIVILAVLLPRHSPPALAPEIARVESGRPQAAAPRVTPPAERPVSRSTPRLTEKRGNNAARRVPVRSQPGEEGLVVAAVTPAESTIDIEPLEDVVPIQVVTIAGTDVAHREVAVPPLRQVTPLQISPLSTPEGRF